jgi:hypothetical protein
LLYIQHFLLVSGFGGFLHHHQTGDVAFLDQLCSFLWLLDIFSDKFWIPLYIMERLQTDNGIFYKPKSARQYQHDPPALGCICGFDIQLLTIFNWVYRQQPVGVISFHSDCRSG